MSEAFVLVLTHDLIFCRGATSTVYKCEQKGTGQTWAVKIINKKVGNHFHISVLIISWSVALI